MGESMIEPSPSPQPPWATMPREFWIIAYIVLAVFLVVMVLILIGCWALLSGKVSMENAAALAAVSGLVGAIAGYSASSVQTVLSTIYGGSISQQHGARTVNAAGPTTINEAAPTDPQPS
jgi:hypothetical protein